jgi:hypothetical protein
MIGAAPLRSKEAKRTKIIIFIGKSSDRSIHTYMLHLILQIHKGKKPSTPDDYNILAISIGVFKVSQSNNFKTCC